MSANESAPPLDHEGITAGRRAWDESAPGRLLGPGHRIADFLDAPSWRVREQGGGRLVVQATLPRELQNYRGQLFGGFTGAYVDFIGLALVRQQLSVQERAVFGLTTLNMRIEYYEPVVGPHFLLEAQILKQRGRNSFLDIHFRSPKGVLLVAASVALRRLEIPASPAEPDAEVDLDPGAEPAG
jgi:acyl-coenzyme A thioesterase PaaI-like protein